MKQSWFDVCTLDKLITENKFQQKANGNSQWYHNTSNESNGANRTPGPSVQVNGHKIVTKTHKVAGPIVSPNQDAYNHFKEIELSCTNQKMDKRRGRESYHCNICSIKKFWLVHLQSTIKRFDHLWQTTLIFFPERMSIYKWMDLTSYRKAVYYLAENKKEREHPHIHQGRCHPNHHATKALIHQS